MTEEGLTPEDLERINNPFTKKDLSYIKTLQSNEGKKEIQGSVGKTNGKGSIVNVQGSGKDAKRSGKHSES